tara:strand:- start:1959 stop:2879 length:921 start_codon:yes stop_codon:yes gene_type:complete
MPLLSTFGGGSVRGFNPGGEGEATPGQDYYTSAGTYSWTCPAGVTSVSVAVLSGGGGAMAPQDISGGAGGDGGWSYFVSTAHGPYAVGGDGATTAPAFRFSGQGYAAGGGQFGSADGGGNGGNGGMYTTCGGGAGGYSGGGKSLSGGGNGHNSSYGQNNAQNGTGGGGAGGYQYASGSSTGLKGQGSNGSTNAGSSGAGGYAVSTGGSGGADGVDYGTGNATGVPGAGGCGQYDRGVGGGGGGLGYKNNITVVPGNSYTVVVGAGGSGGASGATAGGAGGEGGVRIMWGNSSYTRAYPSTNAGDYP